MKHIGNELYRICEKKRLVKKDIADTIGISAVYFSGILRKASIDAGLLEKICKAIGITPAYFFDDYTREDADVQRNTAAQVQERQSDKKEIEMLREMLAEKERTIKILMKAKGFSEEQKRDK